MRGREGEKGLMSEQEQADEESEGWWAGHIHFPSQCWCEEQALTEHWKMQRNIYPKPNYLILGKSQYNVSTKLQ